MTTASQQFDLVSGALIPREQGRILELLVRQLTYHGATGLLELLFEPSGFPGFLTQFSATAVA